MILNFVYMQFHQLKPLHKSRKEKRIGRGGKRGTYSGRGIKGQKARAGHRIRPQERDIIKKIPKLRGYKFKSFRSKPAIVNLSDLEETFQSGDTISPETLYELGLVNRIKGKMPKVKILGRGEITKNFTFKNVIMSASVVNKLKIKDLKGETKS